MTLKAKISKILEGEFSNYYTEREEIESATAQLLALFKKETRKIIGKDNNEMEWENIRRFNRSDVENDEIIDAYKRDDGIRNQLRHSQRTKLAKVMERKHE